MAVDSFLTSENISVFPASGRDNSIRDAYLLGEKNITSILKNIYRKNDCSFVIDLSLVDNKLSGNFVIKGFYFEINQLALGATTSVYATLFTKTNSTTTQQVLCTEDGENELDVISGTTSILKCLKFTDAAYNSKTSGVDSKSILLWDNGKVPEASKLIWDTSSLNIDVKIYNKNLIIETDQIK